MHVTLNYCCTHDWRRHDLQNATKNKFKDNLLVMTACNNKAPIAASHAANMKGGD